MSVSDTGHLSALDAVLYDRPAGRNIIDYAREEIERLRRENELLSAAMSSDGAAACGQLQVAEAEIERLHSALETILTVPVGDGAAASMSKIALKALREKP